MAESPSTMKSVQNIQDLLDLLVEKQIDQTEILAAIQNEILHGDQGRGNGDQGR
ncbi:MAG: hypothetical protein M3Q39_04135 [Actinomycetota bacterium]|nr:hypothetical protein [Actinomycetota bacterium]